MALAASTVIGCVFGHATPHQLRHTYATVWVPETLPWSLACRDGGRC